MDQPVASRISDLGYAIRHFMDYLETTNFFVRAREPGINDFAVGNPQEMPLPGFVDALHRAVEPQDKDWFAYKLSEPETRETVAASLQSELGIPFDPEDIAMTPGAFGALAIAMQVLIDPGDEVIINLPPWFFYELMVVNAGGTAVKVAVDRRTFDLDIDAIAAAITPRTRAIIVNTPNNPTGKIYPAETLERLAAVLEAASERNGRRIYLISDEPYRKIDFSGEPFPTPLAFYDHALMSYSYGKILLAPGQRIGYLALPPTMPNREILRGAIQAVQIAGGFLFPNAVLQHAINDLESLSIDLAGLRKKRDRMIQALTDIGYELHVPEGTFYLLPRSPLEDDVAFIRILSDRNILCLPGTVLEFPGFFRISLTASEEMIEQSLAGFADAFAAARASVPA